MKRSVTESGLNQKNQVSLPPSGNEIKQLEELWGNVRYTDLTSQDNCTPEISALIFSAVAG